MEVEDGRCPDCDVMVTSPASCPHQSTDGTVTCRDCGTTASMFISTAWDWLDAHDGEEFEYNNDECNPLPILRSVDHV
jgi:transcription elongation factor Elf1